MSVPVLTPGERIKRLEKTAADLKVDYHTPIRRYYRSGAEIFCQANSYYDKDRLEQAYLLYFRYLSLFIEKVPKHPEFPSVLNVDKNRVKANLIKVLTRCEEIKSKLKEIYREQDAQRSLAKEDTSSSETDTPKTPLATEQPSLIDAIDTPNCQEDAHSARLRPIVIDGSNVAVQHSIAIGHGNQRFSRSAIKLIPVFFFVRVIVLSRG